MQEESLFPDLTNDEKKLIEDFLSEDVNELSDFGAKRREFLKQVSTVAGAMFAYQLMGGQEVFAHSFNQTTGDEINHANIENGITVAFKVNGLQKTLEVDPRMTLLDALREKLLLTGSKKGCDHGQCGACTVIADGRRILSCLTLTATCEGKSIVTIEGISKNGQLHPVQAAFIKHDGFQCGYCTPGQICSAIALMNEAKNGEVSFVTADVRVKARPLQLSDEEIRERMSGNICRCGAYPNIIAAIREVHSGKNVAELWKFAGENNQTQFKSSV
ncbi:MAG: 2Fe-2S iron-sulfur cluster binding domain-containing protein [Ferruginibacter sp.]|nr:2Fe-2S iron-sulfur cluster binding domain-containing protein [Ferruginibacter sp.]